MTAGPQVVVPASTLAELLKWAAPHVATDASRPALAAIRLVARGNSVYGVVVQRPGRRGPVFRAELRLQATDSYSLIDATIAGAEIVGDLDVLVDGKALCKFRAPAKCAAPVDVATIASNGNGRVEVSALGSETVLALPVQDVGPFPRFEPLYPAEYQFVGTGSEPLGLAAMQLRKLGAITSLSPLRFRFVSPLRPVLAEVEDEGRGISARLLLMPVRLS